MIKLCIVPWRVVIVDPNDLQCLADDDRVAHPHERIGGLVDGAIKGHRLPLSVVEKEHTIKE